MAHRGVRVALLLIAAALLAGAGYRLVDLERRLAATVEEARQFDLQAQEAGRQIAVIKSAQAAYVAAGQGRDYWPARVTTLLRAVTAGLDALSGRVSEDEALRAALDDSRKSIAQFAKLDTRAREYVSESQLLMASDVIFTEGLELLGATASHLDQAREHQRQAHDRRNAHLRRLEMYTIAATGALALLIMLLLVPTGRREAEPEAPADETARVVIRPDLTLRTAPPARLPSSGPEVSLKDASALSLDLARVSTQAELRAVLERAANLLHARGLVLWVPSASGDLRPGLSHGYSEALLAKLPGIAPTADNATAAAYRLGEVREVAAGNSPTGAVIAPLLTPAGCAGVLAVELPAGAESHTAVQAIVTFLAAQLAGTVTVSKPDEGRAASDARSARSSS